MAKRLGGGVLLLQNAPSIEGFAAVGGRMEGKGPLAAEFDELNEDTTFGEKSWEKAESRMQKNAVSRALAKANTAPGEVDIIFAGDLLNQCTGSTYGLRELEIPFAGLYGACSTMAESLCMASMFVEAGFANRAVAVTSSHFCSAERQFRFPLEYGGQRPLTAQWTATASGAVIVGISGKPPFVRAAAIGKISDPGITDAANMGAAMAPAAAMTITEYFSRTGKSPAEFDRIFTGDLGAVGTEILLKLLKQNSLDLTGIHQDCGLLLFDRQTQDVHAGGSGCGCSASVLCAHILPRVRSGEWQNVLFAATGALMSPTLVQQGESIPGICHLVHLSHQNGKEAC